MHKDKSVNDYSPAAKNSQIAREVLRASTSLLMFIFPPSIPLLNDRLHKISYIPRPEDKSNVHFALSDKVKCRHAPR